MKRYIEVFFFWLLPVGMIVCAAVLVVGLILEGIAT
jgi:hypothetical protein